MVRLSAVPGRSRLLQRALALETLLPLASCQMRGSRMRPAEWSQGRHVGLVHLPLSRPASSVPVCPGRWCRGLWGTGVTVGAYVKGRAAMP